MVDTKKMMLGNALEGRSYVGKSTALERLRNIESLRDKGIVIVPEYSVVGDFVKFPRTTMADLKKSITRIIDLEKKRSDILSGALAKGQNGLVLFDRGPVSCIAFEHAAQQAGFKGAALWMAESFQRALGDDQIIVPRGMVHLTATNEIIEERRKNDLASGKGDVINFLRDEEVIKTLKDAFAAFGDYLPKQLFLTLETDSLDPGAVATTVLQFIANQSDAVEETVPDFVAYAENLINRKI